MSSPPSTPSDGTAPAGWLAELLGVPGDAVDGARAHLRGRTFELRDGIWRAEDRASDAQEHTSDTFGFKWAKRSTFESPESLARAREWLVERYGDLAAAPWWPDLGDDPLVLDAGCGAGMSGLLLFGPILDRIRYLGVDISDAVDTAAVRFAEAGRPGAFLQSDLGSIPLPDGSVSLILSEGVLHHTDSTRRALGDLARLLHPGGRFAFYVYARKGPVREFTDDFIRERLQELPPQEAWDALYPLTELGQALGELGVTVDVPKDIDLLGIPAGPIDLQRLFYWHVCKMFYRPDLDLEEMNHINYDWFAPTNAHRQSPEEVRAWCAEEGLEIEREVVEPAGITVIARRR